jgi:hypothetical protein
VRERLDSPFIASSSQRMMLVGLVIVRAMIIIVPLIVAFTFGRTSFLATVFDHVVCISVANDIPKVLFTLTLATLTQGPYAAG